MPWFQFNPLHWGEVEQVILTKDADIEDAAIKKAGKSATVKKSGRSGRAKSVSGTGGTGSVGGGK
jgi:hypothetical protein